MSCGGWNPYPRQIGGAPTALQATYNGLRGALGGTAGHATGPSVELGGLEDAWRYSKALGISKAQSVIEQAILEFFPGSGTYRTHDWEAALRLPRQDDPIAARAAVAAVYSARSVADIPSIQASLRAKFSTSITVTTPTRTLQSVSKLHKTLADRTFVASYGPRAGSALPGFSTAYLLRITWPGAPLTQDQITLLSRTLQPMLPSWVNYEIETGTGFICGTSLLGQVGC